MQFPTKKHFCSVLQCNVLCTLCIELNTLQCIVYTVCILYTVLCRKQGSAHCARVEWTRFSDFTTLTCGCLPPIQPCCTLQCKFYYMSPNFSELAPSSKLTCTFLLELLCAVRCPLNCCAKTPFGPVSGAHGPKRVSGNGQKRPSATR